MKKRKSLSNLAKAVLLSSAGLILPSLGVSGCSESPQMRLISGIQHNVMKPGDSAYRELQVNIIDRNGKPNKINEYSFLIYPTSSNVPAKNLEIHLDDNEILYNCCEGIRMNEGSGSQTFSDGSYISWQLQNGNEVFVNIQLGDPNVDYNINAVSTQGLKDGTIGINSYGKNLGQTGLDVRVTDKHNKSSRMIFSDNISLDNGGNEGESEGEYECPTNWYSKIPSRIDRGVDDGSTPNIDESTFTSAYEVKLTNNGNIKSIREYSRISPNPYIQAHHIVPASLDNGTYIVLVSGSGMGDNLTMYSNSGVGYNFGPDNAYFALNADSEGCQIDQSPGSEIVCTQGDNELICDIIQKE